MWLIQNNMNYEVGVDNLIKYIKSIKADYQLLDIFSNDKNIYKYNTKDIFEINENLKTFIIGSYGFVKRLEHKNLYPGSFLNDNYNYESWVSGWGKENMLNGNYLEMELGNIKIPEDWDVIFSRPLEDNKLFTGGLTRKEDLIFKIETEILNSSNSKEKIIVSKKKEIKSEYRLFVVDNKIITGSMYRMSKQVILSEFIDNTVISFANEMLKKWTPSNAFCLDIAITDEGLKIIEVNNLSSAGFYKSDVIKIVDALENLKSL